MVRPMPTPCYGDLLRSRIALNPSQVIQGSTLSTMVFFLIVDVSLCEESPQVGASHPYNIDHNKTTRVREGIETHTSARVTATQSTSQEISTQTHRSEFAAQQVLKSQTQ